MTNPQDKVRGLSSQDIWRLRRISTVSALNRGEREFLIELADRLSIQPTETSAQAVLKDVREQINLDKAPILSQKIDETIEAATPPAEPSAQAKGLLADLAIELYHRAAMAKERAERMSIKGVQHAIEDALKRNGTVVEAIEAIRNGLPLATHPIAPVSESELAEALDYIADGRWNDNEPTNIRTFARTILARHGSRLVREK